MSTPPDVLPDAIIYMRMTSASVPLIAVYNYASSMQRALGDSTGRKYGILIQSMGTGSGHGPQGRSNDGKTDQVAVGKHG